MKSERNFETIMDQLRENDKHVVLLRDPRKAELFELLKYTAIEFANLNHANIAIDASDHSAKIEMDSEYFFISADDDPLICHHFCDLLNNASYVNFESRDGRVHLKLWFDFMEDFYIQ